MTLDMSRVVCCDDPETSMKYFILVTCLISEGGMSRAACDDDSDALRRLYLARRSFTTVLYTCGHLRV